MRRHAERSATAGSGPGIPARPYRVSSVSSSAHLIVMPWILGWSPLGVRFDVMVHLGTLLAVLIYFRKDWWSLVHHFTMPLREGPRQPAEPLAGALLLGTLPSVLVGGFFFPVIKEYLRGPLVAAAALALFALILFWPTSEVGRTGLWKDSTAGRGSGGNSSDIGVHTRSQPLRRDGHGSAATGPEAP